MNEQPAVEGVNDVSAVQVHPVQVHYLEAFDALSNIAKVTGVYINFMNAAFQMTTVLLSEIGLEHVDEVIGRMAAQAQVFRDQRAAEQATQSQNETGATNVH